MLDVVIDHVAPVDLDFDKISPFNKSSDYYTKCELNNMALKE